jgi:hypothetical protein
MVQAGFQNDPNVGNVNHNLRKERDADCPDDELPAYLPQDFKTNWKGR